MNDPNEVITKFRLTKNDINRGTSQDLICPGCGGRSRFEIGGVCVGIFDSKGIMVDMAEFDFHEHSLCVCGLCNHEGDVSEFRVKGLDAALEKLSRKT